MPKKATTNQEWRPDLINYARTGKFATGKAPSKIPGPLKKEIISINAQSGQRICSLIWHALVIVATTSEYVKVPICIFCTHFFELLTPKSKTLAH